MEIKKRHVFLFGFLWWLFFIKTSIGPNFLSGLVKQASPVISQIQTSGSGFNESKVDGADSASRNSKPAKTAMSKKDLKKDPQMTNLADSVWVYNPSQTETGSLRPVVAPKFFGKADNAPVLVSDYLNPQSLEKADGLVGKLAGLAELNLVYYSGNLKPGDNYQANNLIVNISAMGHYDPGSGVFALGLVTNNNPPRREEALGLVGGLDFNQKSSRVEIAKRLYPGRFHSTETVAYLRQMRGMLSILKEKETSALIASVPGIRVQYGDGGFAQIMSNYRTLQSMDKATILARFKQSGYPLQVKTLFKLNPDIIDLNAWDVESLRIARAVGAYCDENSANCSGIARMGNALGIENPKEAVLFDILRRQLAVNVVSEGDLKKRQSARIIYMPMN